SVAPNHCVYLEPELPHRLEEVLRAWIPSAAGSREPQVALEQRFCARHVGEHHRIDMRRSDDRIQIEALLAVRDSLRALPDLHRSGRLRRLRVATTVELILGIRVTRGQNSPQLDLMPLLHEHGGSER